MYVDWDFPHMRLVVCYTLLAKKVVVSFFVIISISSVREV